MKLRVVAAVALAIVPTMVANAFYQEPYQKAYGFLADMMDRYNRTFDVYTDDGAAGNHFFALGMMPDETAGVTMDLESRNSPYSGATCIKCTYEPARPHWGGFYFLNGTLEGDETTPQLNWGTKPDAGVNLEGADRVTFWARGAKGGERVQFFVGGVGWKCDYKGNSVTSDAAYPDSLPKITTGYVTLSNTWQKYSIDVRGKNLKNVLGGFGWAADSQRNRNREIAFFIDDIKWNEPRPDDMRLLVSYETDSTRDVFDVVMQSVAFTYDNSIAILSLLARGQTDDVRRARILASSLAYATRNDRFYSDRRIRNAYSGGDLSCVPGWSPNGKARTARLPVFINQETGACNEDRVMVGTHTGNAAWAMIALTTAFQKLGDRKFLTAAQSLAEWVEANCRDERGAGGYSGGFEGWEPVAEKVQWKSTEHNIDLYVAFTRLYQATWDLKWKARADYARKFVESMWDDKEGKFWTGTADDGVQPYREVVPIDVQAWAILAMPDSRQKYARGLDYAEKHGYVRGGYDFNTDRDGIWYEGTAHMAAAYRAIGRTEKATSILGLLESAQTLSGAIPSASTDGLTTGFGLSLESTKDLMFYNRGHVGATAWYLLAKMGTNPFWIR